MSLKLDGKVYKIDSYEVHREKKIARIRFISFEGPARSTDFEMRVAVDYQDPGILHGVQTEVDSDLRLQEDKTQLTAAADTDTKEAKESESREVFIVKKKQIEKQLADSIERISANCRAKLVKARAQAKFNRFFDSLNTGNTLDRLYFYAKNHPRFEGAADV